MDWSQWQNVAGSGQFPQQNGQQNGQQNWNNQMRNQNPGWIRPGQQQPQPNYGQQGQPQQPGGQGQPRPGVHPEDWNNNNRVPPPPPNGPPPGSNGWPPQQPPRPPPPPNGPPPGWDEQMKNRSSSRHVFSEFSEYESTNFSFDFSQMLKTEKKPVFLTNNKFLFFFNIEILVKKFVNSYSENS